MQRYLDRLADFTITRLLLLLLLLFSLCSHTLCLVLAAFFIYPNVVLHFRSVGQITTYYRTVWTNRVIPRPFGRQQFFSAVVFCFGRDISRHACSRIGFADYKVLIKLLPRAATDNSFLLFYMYKCKKSLIYININQ